MGCYSANIPFSCLKINMVSTVVLRLCSLSHSLSWLLSLWCCVHRRHGSRRAIHFVCFLNESPSGICLILPGRMAAGTGLADLWKLLNREVAPLSTCCSLGCDGTVVTTQHILPFMGRGWEEKDQERRRNEDYVTTKHG